MKTSTLITIIIAFVVIAGVFVFLFLRQDRAEYVAPEEQETTEIPEPQTEEEPVEEEPLEDEQEPEEIIGTSAGDNDITAYHYGSGDTELLFIGGIHGGYSWNTALVAYELMDYLEENPSSIPENVMVTVIPVLNPDGLEEVVGTTGRFERGDVPTSEAATIPGRFNANGVDLNRNFDCDWQAQGTWQNRTVSGGSSVFSEPEAQAIRDYVTANDPEAVVVYYSAVGGVFASNCHNGVLPETAELVNVYADASGYKPYESFDFYTITGDMVNWLAKEEIPGISILLTNHTDTEWTKNKAGIDAVLEYYAE